MRIRDRIIVVDVESTCWLKNPPKGMVSEIIEIGYVELHRMEDVWVPVIGDSILIKPTRGNISPFCTHLTGWKPEDFTNAGTYEDAVKKLRARDAKNSIMASWGKYDDKMFYRMSEMHGVAYPFNNDHLNVKALFGAHFGYVTGVEDALAKFDMTFQGRPHRGIDDATNIAELLLRLLNRNAMSA